MQFIKCVIGGKSNYTQIVFCRMGEISDDKHSELIGFKDSIPVLKPKMPASNMKDSPIKKIVKVEIDPFTGDKFINLNGKKLRMIPESQVPASIKESTQAIKINSPAHVDKRKSITILGKIPPVISGSSKVPMKTHESLVYKTLNKNISVNNLSEKSLIKHTPVIKVKNPIIDTDVKPQVTDKSLELITHDKDNFSTTNNKNIVNRLSYSIPKPVLKVCGQKIEKINMQALDLTKHLADKCVQTDKEEVPEKQLVDVNIQVGGENDILNDLSELFETDLEYILNTSLPLQVVSPTSPYVPSKHITDLDNDDKQKDVAVKFFRDIRSAFVADDKGNMPIHVGVLKNNLNQVKRCGFILQSLKQSIDLPNNYNNTALQLSIMHNADEEIISYLLGAGADLDICNSDGNNVIHLACEYERIDCLKTLVKHAEKLENNNVLNQHNHDGLTPLMICAVNNLQKCADILLRYDAEIDKRDQISGRTALFHAAENQHLDMVRLLLKFGANTKMKNFFGTSPHDAMYEVEEMDETIRIMILGKSMKRKLPDERPVIGKVRRKDDKKDDKKVELRTYARLEKITNMKIFAKISPNKESVLTSTNNIKDEFEAD